LYCTAHPCFASLFCRFTVSLFRQIVAPPFPCFVHSSLLRRFLVLLHRFLVSPLFRCFLSSSLHHFLVSIFSPFFHCLFRCFLSSSLHRFLVSSFVPQSFPSLVRFIFQLTNFYFTTNTTVFKFTYSHHQGFRLHQSVTC